MRLIDADEFKFKLMRYDDNDLIKVKYVCQYIDNAPTVNIKPFASFTFDKEQLEQIVEDRVIEPIKNGELVVKTEERPQGTWQLHGMIYYCSECGHECGESGDNFCGNCGADMRVKDELGGRE